MTLNYIGVVYNKNTKEFKAVINPDYDEQLDMPCWTESTENEELKMIKIERTHKKYGDCPASMNSGDCDIAIRIAKEKLGWG